MIAKKGGEMKFNGKNQPARREVEITVSQRYHIVLAEGGSAKGLFLAGKEPGGPGKGGGGPATMGQKGGDNGKGCRRKPARPPGMLKRHIKGKNGEASV